jgi:hypothetical protein
MLWGRKDSGMLRVLTGRSIVLRYFSQDLYAHIFPTFNEIEWQILRLRSMLPDFETVVDILKGSEGDV